MKKRLLILIGLISFIFPFRAFALSGNVTLTCDKNKVSSGSTINCSIKGNVSEEVSSVHAEVKLGDGLTLVNPQSSSIWQGNGEGGVYDLYTDVNKTGTFDIGTFSVKVGDLADNGSFISLKNVILSDASFNEQSFDVSSVNVKIPSTVNTLTGISISNGNINFSEGNTNYDLEIDSDNTEISVTKKDETSKVTGDVGKKSLKYGLNTFKITVTSESGLSKVYTLNITRPDKRSNDNTLASLKLSKGDIKFNKDTTTYNVTLEHTVSSIKVDATLNDNKSSFESGYGPREVNLKYGTNVIEIKVKAENERVKTYKINVTRKNDPKDERSSNNYLSELNLSSGKLEFSKDVLEYKVTVLYEVDKISVTAKTEDSKASYEVSNLESLVVGENTIVVTVKAENGSTREYKVVVVRKEESEKLSDNNKLSSLSVNGYELNFNSSIFEYNLTIGKESTLDISYEKEDESSEVLVKGNEELKNGSVISVNVTSESGVTAVYKINILKEEDSNLLIYVIIGGALLLLVLILLVVLKSKKKDNNNNNSNGNVNNHNDFTDLAIKQNFQYAQTPNMNNNTNNNVNTIPTINNGMQNVQNIENMTFNRDNIQNGSNN